VDELKEQLEKKIEQGMEFEGPEPPPDAGEGDEDMQVIVLAFFLLLRSFHFLCPPCFALLIRPSLGCCYTDELIRNTFFREK